MGEEGENAAQSECPWSFLGMLGDEDCCLAIAVHNNDGNSEYLEVPNSHCGGVRDVRMVNARVNEGIRLMRLTLPWAFYTPNIFLPDKWSEYN